MLWMTPPSLSPEDIENMRKELEAIGFNDSEINKEINRQLGKQPEIQILPDLVPIFNWFVSVDDLFRFEKGVCTGLDVVAVKADSEMKQKEIKPGEYVLLREMGKAAAIALNKQFIKRQS